MGGGENGGRGERYEEGWGKGDGGGREGAYTSRDGERERKKKR